MRAFRLLGRERAALQTVPRPVPGPGEALLRVGASAFCHSDVHHFESTLRPAGMNLPVTMGHELAGYVEALGVGTDGPAVGSAVAVYIAHGCGRCPACSNGEDIYCDEGFGVPGVHFSGGMAEYVVVRAGNLVDAQGIDSTTAAVLTDAGVTAHHAVAHGLRTVGSGGRAMVIGIGGLGHIAIQILRARGEAEILAIDVDSAHLELAIRLGAHEAYLAEDLESRCARRSVDVVYDFVGSTESLTAALRAVRPGGMLVVVGLGGGSLELAQGQPRGAWLGIPRNTTVVGSLLGTRADLEAVLEMARRSMLCVVSRTYSLDQAGRALEDVRAGRIVGRAVVVPGSAAVSDQRGTRA